MKLGFHYHIPARIKDDQIWMPGYQTRFVDSLAAQVEQVICFLHSPLPSETHLMDSPITAQNVKLVDLGYHDSLPVRMLRSWKIKKIIVPFQDDLDMILIRGPSPLLPRIASVFDERKLAFLIVGDNTEGIEDLPQPWWRKDLIRLFWKLNKYQQQKFIRKALTFVNSQQRYDNFKNNTLSLRLIRTTTLREEDIFIREDSLSTPPFHILYAGRIDRSKGLFEIVEAIYILKKEGLDIVFDIVGWPEKKDSIIEELVMAAKIFGIRDRVIFHGYKIVGPELFEYYKKSDIFVIASKVSEGFPRTIWEAMAHSLPVVATKVGSIPHFIEGVAELVEPSSPVALVEGIKKIIFDKKFRLDSIRKGRKIAQENTLEVQSKKMIEEIEKWLV